MASNWERHAPLSGVVAVVLWVIGIILVSDAVGKDKASEILAQIQSNTNQIFIGSLIWLIGTGFFIWFLGSLRVRLLAAEGPTARLTAIAFAGGVAAAVFGAGIVGPDTAAAISEDDIDASAASAMHHMGDAFFIGAEYMLPVLLTATALVALRYGAFPKWLAWVSLLIALVLLIAPIGWAALIFAFPLWVLVVSVLMWRWAQSPTGAREHHATAAAS